MTSFHDNNSTHTLLAVQSNGTTLINVKADPTSHGIKTSDGTTGSDNGPSKSLHDGNNVPILMATSSADGITPVAVYADSLANLLTKSS